MPILIAVIFIGWYFYRAAVNAGKNGLLWVGIALTAFTLTSFIVGLIVVFLARVFFEWEGNDEILLGFYLGSFIGVIGLFRVNYFLNQIPD
jgi:hypothetical protein